MLGVKYIWMTQAHQSRGPSASITGLGQERVSVVRAQKNELTVA